MEFFWYPDLAWSDQKRALKQEHSRKLPSKTFLSLEIWSLLFSLNENPGWSLGHRTTYYFLLLFSSEESLNLSINVKESKKLQKFKIYAWSSIRYLQMHSYECTFLCYCCLWQSTYYLFHCLTTLYLLHSGSTIVFILKLHFSHNFLIHKFPFNALF